MGAARREVEYIGGFSMLRGYRIRSIDGGVYPGGTSVSIVLSVYVSIPTVLYWRIA